MKVSQKILKVLELKGMSVNRAERLIGVSTGTLSKVIERDAGWHPSTENKFIQGFKIKRNWWDTSVGQIFENIPDSNGNEFNDLALKTAYDLIERMRKEIHDLEEQINTYKTKGS